MQEVAHLISQIHYHAMMSERVEIDHKYHVNTIAIYYKNEGGDIVDVRKIDYEPNWLDSHSDIVQALSEELAIIENLNKLTRSA